MRKTKTFEYKDNTSIIGCGFGKETEGRLYFRSDYTNITISKMLKEKYNISVIRVGATSAVKYVSSDFFYAVRDSKELQQLILDKEPTYTKETLLDHVNLIISVIEHPENRSY